MCGAFKYGDVGRMTEADTPGCKPALNSWRRPSVAQKMAGENQACAKTRPADVEATFRWA